MLVVGALGGLLNGLLVARGGLPSLVVTLGTLALFRGLALIVLGPRGVSDFPPAFTELGFGTCPGRRSRGRSSSSSASPSCSGSCSTGRGSAARSTPSARTPARRASPASASLGVRVGLFVLSGLIAALAGIILTSRLSSARADAGAGMTLTVVTVVLLGGVNIFGGSGTIPGVVLAVIAVAVMQNALRLASVTVEVQSIALGSLLILSVVIPTLLTRPSRPSIESAEGGLRRPTRSTW